jgi:hypothetical protein
MLNNILWIDLPPTHAATKIPFMYSQKRNCAVWVPISTFMYLRTIYIFPGSVRPHILLQQNRGIPIVGIYKSLTDTWMWKVGLRPGNSFSGNICFKFWVLCLCSAPRHLSMSWAWRRPAWPPPPFWPWPLCGPAGPGPQDSPVAQHNKARVMFFPMDQITIKTPNPKGRLYRCLIEFCSYLVHDLTLCFIEKAEFISLDFFCSVSFFVQQCISC